MFPTKFFPHFHVDNASELTYLVGLFVKPSSMILSVLYSYSMHLKKKNLINIQTIHSDISTILKFIYFRKQNTLTLIKKPQTGPGK